MLLLATLKISVQIFYFVTKLFNRKFLTIFFFYEDETSSYRSYSRDKTFRKILRLLNTMNWLIKQWLLSYERNRQSKHIQKLVCINIFEDVVMLRDENLFGRTDYPKAKEVTWHGINY